ncbi:MAG: hypothetical protein WCK78_06625 [Paludibacter sp.]
MKDYSKEIIPMSENKEYQQAFNEMYNSFHNFIELATEYFENAGVDIDDEDLIDCLDIGVYPFEEFQNGMPPADKLKYGGDFLQDPENKVFYLNINYANLADRLKAYQLLDRFGINFYPVHIIDNRHVRSYYIPNAPDKEVQDLIDRIKAKQILKEELDEIMSNKRKQDHKPVEAFTWILNDKEKDILAITDKNRVYFDNNYDFDIRLTAK